MRGDFEVRSQSLAVVNTNDDGSVTTSQDIGVALYAPGDFTTPPFTVTVITSDGKSTDQTAPPVTLTVASVLTQDDTALRDIRPQADLQPPSPLPEILAGLAGAAVLLGVLALIYRRFLRMRRAQTAAAFVDLRTPYERARDALDELERQNLIGQGMYKAYYSRLSEALRTYIDDVYDVNAPDMTTFEIRRRLKAVRELDSGLAQRALRVLSECDLVKFAKSEPEHDAARVLLEEVRVWLDLTRPALLPDAVESVAEGAA